MTCNTCSELSGIIPRRIFVNFADCRSFRDRPETRGRHRGSPGVALSRFLVPRTPRHLAPRVLPRPTSQKRTEWNIVHSDQVFERAPAACPQGTFGLITRVEAGHLPAGDPYLPPPHSPPTGPRRVHPDGPSMRHVCSGQTRIHTGLRHCTVKNTETSTERRYTERSGRIEGCPLSTGRKTKNDHT